MYDDYNLVISSSGKNYFLGLKIDETTHKIDKGYACGIKSENPNQGTAFCIEGFLDDNHGGNADTRNTIFESNRDLLQRSKLWNNTCNVNNLRTYCEGQVFANSISNDNTNVGQEVDYCRVSTIGTFYCYH